MPYFQPELPSVLNENVQTLVQCRQYCAERNESLQYTTIVNKLPWQGILKGEVSLYH